MKKSRYDQLGESIKSSSGIFVFQAKSRVEIVEKDGKNFLIITLLSKRSDEGLKEFDISFLLALPNLYLKMAESILSWSNGKSMRSVFTTITHLKIGFVEFLAETDRSKISLAELSTSLAKEFVHWLNQESKIGEARWAVGTRTILLKALKVVTTNLFVIPEWREEFGRKFTFPKNPWPGNYRLHRPIQVIERDTFIKLYNVCIKEVVEIIGKFNFASVICENYTEENIITGLRTNAYMKNFELKVAATNKCLSKNILSCKEFKKIYPGLGLAIEKSGGFQNFTDQFFPSPRAIVPFVLLFAIHFAYNPDSLLEMETGDINFETLFGSSRVRASPKKQRSKRRQRRSYQDTDDVDNPGALYRFLISWTERLRSDVSLNICNRLFLFRNGGATPKTCSYSNLSGGSTSGDSLWRDSLRRFCVENELEPITLSQTRQTVIDLSHELFNGDLRAVKAVGGQRDPDVINSHYTSDGARQRNDESLAMAMALRERDRQSRGRIDARRAASEGDVSGATPGWGCLDPYSSPFFNQAKKGLCSAYGLCPICPLAMLDFNSSIACARTFELISLIDLAKSEIDPVSWLTRWAPVREKILTYWIHQFSAETLREALKLSLSKMPPLE